jgi:hypothetical protein
MNPLGNSKGGILLLGLSLVPLFLTAIFAGMFLLDFLYLKSQVQKACFTGPRETQNKSIGSLEKLLALNNVARGLKILETTTRISLKIALRGLPYSAPLVASLKIKLATIIADQIKLGIMQKEIIYVATLAMQKSIQTTHASLKSIFNQFGEKRIWLDIHSSVHSDFSEGLAVEAESSDRAPVYRLKNNFESKQMLAHSWHFNLESESWLSRWTTKSLVWNDRCFSTLGQEAKQWTVKSNLKSNLGNSSSSRY